MIGFAPGLTATVEAVSRLSPRLVELSFSQSGDELWAARYRIGRPVQYSYLAGPLELWHTQTSYASRPWAVEQPSAGRPLAVETLMALRRAGVGLATLTHAAGLSSTGDPAIDAALPFPERYDIPAETVAAVRGAARVIAAGTTVVRALEGASLRSELRSGPGITDLKIGPGFRPKVVRGLLTGLHEPGSSHFELLQAFAPEPLLRAAFAHAEQAGYLGHEFGDSSLILT
jgi:S-adenosylmethionine:tRNA ribosyltransferase-isomerase